MDTSLPPLTCDGCGEPVWPQDQMVWRTGIAKDDDGAESLVASLIYHGRCAPADE